MFHAFHSAANKGAVLFLTSEGLFREALGCQDQGAPVVVAVCVELCLGLTAASKRGWSFWTCRDVSNVWARGLGFLDTYTQYNTTVFKFKLKQWVHWLINNRDKMITLFHPIHEKFTCYSSLGNIKRCNNKIKVVIVCQQIYIHTKMTLI